MNGLSASLAGSEEMVGVRRRLFRQLIESLLYERVIQKPVITERVEQEYRLEGRNEAGEAVHYIFRAARKQSFDRIRLADHPVMRFGENTMAEADSVARFVLELSEQLEAPVDVLSRFTNELQQTLLKDAQSVRWNSSRVSSPGKDYDEWESGAIDGHPYHPCYKSRVGFTLADNLAYGPEFRPEFQLVWLAIRSDAVRLSVSASLGGYADLIRNELGADELKRFGDIVKRAVPDVEAEGYVYVPVHPWQWEHILSTACLDQLSTGEIVFIGQAGDVYRPQQSIRTLTNITERDKPYVKLPMNIVNTSSGRILAQHTIMNAARVSDWLGRIVAEDAFLQKELGLIVLREIAGVSYHHQKLPEMLEQQVYGSLGAIWRESLHPYLANGEEALPFNALTQLNERQEPVIGDWLERHGLKNWCAQLLRVTAVPLLHLLYAHGAGLESHAQNMILIVKDGLPVRVALKDFHDGVRYCPTVPHPLGYPKIEYPPANHHGVNRNSFLEKESPADVKDFMLDALLFIHLTEFAFFLEKHYGLSERTWWGMLAEVISDYQQRFPELQERYGEFDVFSAEIEVEQLTRRRIHTGPGDCVHRVANPLHAHSYVR